MKNLLVFISFIFLVSCTPYKIVETTSTDSTGKAIKTKVKYYQESTNNQSKNTIVVPYYPYNYYSGFYSTRIFVPYTHSRIFVPLRHHKF